MGDPEANVEGAIAGDIRAPQQPPSEPTDELAYKEFMVLVKNIASEITNPAHLEMLGYFEGIAVSEVKGKSALELLSDMMRKGRFSYTDVQPLQNKLKDIDRPDLVREVDKYQQKYGDRVGCSSSSAKGGALYRVNSLPTHHSSPIQPSRNPRHSFPSITTPISLESVAPRDPHCSLPKGSVASYHKYYPTHSGVSHSTPVLAEEGEEGEGAGGGAMKSLLVGSKGHWITDVNTLNNLCATVDDHTPPTSPSAISPVMMVPPGPSPFHCRRSEQREEPSEPTLSITSKQSQNMEVVGTMDLESGQLQLSLPYATTATLKNSPAANVPHPPAANVPRPPAANVPRPPTANVPHPPAANVPRPPAANVPRPPAAPHALANRPSMTTACSTAANVPQGTENALDMRPSSKLHDWGGVLSFSLGGSSLASETSNTLSNQSGSLYNGQTSRSHQGSVCNCQASQPARQTRQSGRDDMPISNLEHATEHPRSASVENSISSQGDSLCTSWQGTSKVYTVEECVRLDASNLSRLIGNRELVGVECTQLTLTIPIKCNNRPSITLKVLPRREFHSKSVSVKGSLHIPGKCSWHKWLVQYSHSVVRLSTAVFKEGQQNCCISRDSVEEAIVSASELSCDSHLTHLVLGGVLEHEQVVYDKASHFTLRVTAELVVHGFREDRTACQYQVVVLDKEGEYVKIDKIQANQPDHH